MTRVRGRMAIALLAVVGGFVSLYLVLYKLGFYGQLACGGQSSCAVVQTSEYSELFGLPVAGWGLGWYLAVLGTALAGVRPPHLERSWPRNALTVLAAGGVAFTGYLTYAELFILHAICWWCVASAVLVVIIAGLVAREWWADRGGRRTARRGGAGMREGSAAG